MKMHSGEDELLLSGDIETNPGPGPRRRGQYRVDNLNATPHYEVAECISATHHQGNIVKYGTAAGSQCVAMSLAGL